MNDIVAKLFPDEVCLRGGAAARQAAIGNYVLDFIRGGPVLVVAFESESSAIERGDNLRDGCDLSLFPAEQFSILSVKAKIANWYRGPLLHKWFRAADCSTLLGQFSDHVFFGCSMGGYAAIAFSRIRPGALVIAFDPQATLSRDEAPWETRFASGRKQDWHGDFADAAREGCQARKLYVVYDPFHINNNLHAALLAQENLIALKLPFMGHGTDEALEQLGVRREVVAMALVETLTYENFAQMVRPRRRLPRYFLKGVEQLSGQPKRAFAMLKAGLSKHQYDADLYREGVSYYYLNKKYRNCIELYEGRLSLAEKLPSEDQGILRAYAGTVRVMIDKIKAAHMKKPQNSAAYLINEINYDSKSVKELLLSGRLLMSVGDYAGAERIAHSALALAPGLQQARRLLNIAMEKQKTETPKKKSWISRVVRTIVENA